MAALTDAPLSIDDADAGRTASRARRYKLRRRALIQQCSAVAFVGAGFGYIALNIVRNLDASGMTGGFGFLWQEAGFSMSFSLIPMPENASYGRVYLAGIANTLFVAVTALILSTVFGVIIGLARSAPSRSLRLLAKTYVEAVRNVPLLLILIFTQTVALRSLPVAREALHLGGGVFLSNRGVYLPVPTGDTGHIMAAFGGFALISFVVAYLVRPRTPILRPVDVAGSAIAALAGALSLIVVVMLVDWHRPAFSGFDLRGGIKLMPEFVALIVALVLYNAAFIAEIVRAGIASVDRGQVEAARALGFGHRFVQRRIVLPQAMRLMIPPITNQYAHLVKASSLGTVVGFPDLVNVFLGTSLNQTGRAIEIVTLTTLVYLTINLALGSASAACNARMRLKDR